MGQHADDVMVPLRLFGLSGFRSHAVSPHRSARAAPRGRLEARNLIKALVLHSVPSPIASPIRQAGGRGDGQRTAGARVGDRHRPSEERDVDRTERRELAAAPAGARAPKRVEHHDHPRATRPHHTSPRWSAVPCGGGGAHRWALFGLTHLAELPACGPSYRRGIVAGLNTMLGQRRQAEGLFCLDMMSCLDVNFC